MEAHTITINPTDQIDQATVNTVTASDAGDHLSQTPILKDEIQYASFSNRVGAHISDSMYFTLIGLPLKLILPGYYNPYESLLASAYAFAYVYGIGAICRLFWVPALQSSKKQSSWGQRAMDIYICTKSGQRLGFFLALGRYCLRILSIASVFGILTILWDKKRRALHDIICGTEVRVRVEPQLNR